MNVKVSILDGPLPAVQALRIDGAGAVICFEGVVRPTENGHGIDALDYETYEPMAQKMLAQLAERAIERFGLLAVHVEHSRGRVPAGGCSFRMIVASPHRAEGLAAMGWFIDQMKQDVPIWKRVADGPREGNA